MLVLNQSYEPLTICNIKKALILLLLGKAEIVSKDLKKSVRTIHRTFPWPSVIRLASYISVPYKKVVLTRKNILRRDEFKCAYCGRSDIPLTIDHIVPKAKGGADSWDNLVAACTLCNNKKGDRSPHDAHMKLLIKPFTPSHILFIKNSVRKLDDSWKQYMYMD